MSKINSPVEAPPGLKSPSSTSGGDDSENLLLGVDDRGRVRVSTLSFNIAQSSTTAEALPGHRNSPDVSDVPTVEAAAGMKEPGSQNSPDVSGAPAVLLGEKGPSPMTDRFEQQMLKIQKEFEVKVQQVASVNEQEEQKRQKKTMTRAI